MSKRNKSDDSGDDPGFSDSDLALIRDNDWTVDSTGNVFDDHGNELPPGVVAGAIVVDEMDIPAAKRADPLAAMFRPTRTEPNAMGQSALRYATVGTPPAPFAQPGEAVDSDGVIGTSGEWHAELPDVESMPVPEPAGTDSSAVATAQQPFGAESNWQVGAGVSPPPNEYAQAQARGAGLMATLAGLGQGSLTPEALKADHRAAHSGQYVNGPTQPQGTPAGPSHEVAQVDLSNDASASAFIGSTRAPTQASVPTVRAVPAEDTKGATL